MNRRLLWVWAVLLALCAPAWAKHDRLDAYVRAEMLRSHIPGLSLAVVRDGQVVLAKGYGWANVELSVPARPDTVYQLASVTKQFTATAIMMLVEEGKISLGDKVTTLLPDLPSAWSDVTVRHLLTHTSGIKSYTDLREFTRTLRKDYTHDEIIKLVADLPLDFQPGEKWHYDNTGYFLLGMIIERVSGKSYGEFLAERIFRPLQMTSTRVNDLTELIPNRAAGYTWRGNRLRQGEYTSPTQPYAAGALVSTVEDLAKWDAALYTETLVKRSTLQRMWTPAKLNDGKGTTYGFGWGVDDYRGHRLIGHGGGIPGFSTQISRFVDDRVTVIVLCNLDGGDSGALARGVAARYISPLQASLPKGIDDSDPKTTAMLKGVLIRAADGAADPSLFTSPARAPMFLARARETHDYLGLLGRLNAFLLLERTETSGRRALRYRATFGDTPLIAAFTLAEDGKIASAALSPE
jgi:D-alanyl-D-alanine carboxypeptidase